MPDKTDENPQNLTPGPGPWAALPAAIVIGLSAGLIDGVITFNTTRSQAIGLIGPWPLVAIVAAGLGFGYWMTHLAFERWIAKRFGLRREGLAPAALVFWIALISILFATSFPAMIGTGRAKIYGPIYLAVAAFSSVVAYHFATDPARSRRFAFPVKVLFLCAVPISGLAFAGAWVHAFELAASQAPGLLWMDSVFIVCGIAIVLLGAVFAARWRNITAGAAILAAASLGIASIGRHAQTASLIEQSLGGHPSRIGESEAPDHVILITIDTLRADHLSCYSDTAPPTPNIDQLAKDGVRFAHTIAPSPWTLPSLASIVTGLYPDTHLITHRFAQLSNELVTMAEFLRADGYATAATVENLYLMPNYNFTQGFDLYRSFPPQVPPRRGGVGSLIVRSYVERLEDRVAVEDQVDDLLKRIARNRNSKSFFWLHTFDPHYPYAPPVRFHPASPPAKRIGYAYDLLLKVVADEITLTSAEQAWIGELYKAEVRYIDEQIGRLIDGLRILGVYDKTLIILTSDHGEEFWDHGGYEHGHTLYQELLEVPLIIKAPRIPKGLRIETRVSLTSILPTLLDILGIPHDPERFAAPSLTPLWSDLTERFYEEPIISNHLLYNEAQESVTFENMKYIRPLGDSAEMLFDLAVDPAEKNNLALERRRELPRFRALIAHYRRQAKELRNANTLVEINEIPFDAKAIEDLQALGYLR